MTPMTVDLNRNLVEPQIVFEASDLGFKPGEWPLNLVDEAGGLWGRWEPLSPLGNDGPIGYVYRRPGTTEHIRVIND